MALRLVAVEGDPIPASTLAEELEAFADSIEPDATGVISVVVLGDSSLRVAWHGEDYSPYELMGLFEAAKLRVFADSSTAICSTVKDIVTEGPNDRSVATEWFLDGELVRRDVAVSILSGQAVAGEQAELG
jgi:hypothetical protein